MEVSFQVVEGTVKLFSDILLALVLGSVSFEAKVYQKRTGFVYGIWPLI